MLLIDKCGIFLCDYFENSLLSFLTFCVLSLYPTCYILRWSDSNDSKFEYAVCEDILRSKVIKYYFWTYHNFQFYVGSFDYIVKTTIIICHLYFSS